MFSKSKRLNLKNDFKWLISGKKFDTNYATFYIRFGENEFPKVAVAVSSTYLKKAVERNKVKRVFYQVFESVYDYLPKSINILALPKDVSFGVKSGELKKQLEKLKLDD